MFNINFIAIRFIVCFPDFNIFESFEFIHLYQTFWSPVKCCGLRQLTIDGVIINTSSTSYAQITSDLQVHLPGGKFRREIAPNAGKKDSKFLVKNNEGLKIYYVVHNQRVQKFLYTIMGCKIFGKQSGAANNNIFRASKVLTQNYQKSNCLEQPRSVPVTIDYEPQSACNKIHSMQYNTNLTCEKTVVTSESQCAFTSLSVSSLVCSRSRCLFSQRTTNLN